MTGMGERAYAYAKACGIIGKSFVGKRARALEKAGRLSELDRMLFPSAARDLPERELLPDLEDRIIGRAAHSILSIVDCFSAPPEFLTLLVRGYEYEDLKSAVIAAGEKQAAPPARTDIGRYQTVRFDAWPDIAAMIRGTEFAFLLDKKNAVAEQGAAALQTALDQHYYKQLWSSLSSLPQKDRRAAERILSEEISLRNSSWALRLRTYYHMEAEEIKPHLIDIPAAKSAAKTARRLHESLAAEAIQSLDFPLDSFAPWASWRWMKFLNPETGDAHWHADPRYFQNASSVHLYELARHCFRLSPFSFDTIFCFIKLKLFEEDLLTSGAEALSMGMPLRDAVLRVSA